MDDALEPLPPCTQPVFTVCLDGDIPSFMPAAAPAVQKRPSLSELFAHLMAAAGCNVIAAPASAAHPPSIHDGFGALMEASNQFLVGPGIPLAEAFWTHVLAYRRGTVTRALRAAALQGQHIQGFLTIYATDVRSPLLYTENAPPLRVRETIDVPPGVDGPFLVLVVCELAENEDARPIRGYAQPVYQARRFVPVASNLERDVLKILEHLQTTLESFGLDAEVIREIPDCVASHDQTARPATITLAAVNRTGTQMRLTMLIGAEPGSTAGADVHAFSIDRTSLESGALVSWLQREIYSVYHRDHCAVAFGATTNSSA